MVTRLRSFGKMIPLIIVSLLVALAVWILAVTSSDPSETRLYANEVLDHAYTRYNVTEETKKEIDPLLQKQEH